MKVDRERELAGKAGMKIIIALEGGSITRDGSYITSINQFSRYVAPIKIPTTVSITR